MAPENRGPCQREHSALAPSSAPRFKSHRKTRNGPASAKLGWRLWGPIRGGPGGTCPRCCSRCPSRVAETLEGCSLMTRARYPVGGSTCSLPWGWGRGRIQRARGRSRRCRRKSGPYSPTSGTKVSAVQWCFKACICPRGGAVQKNIISFP